MLASWEYSRLNDSSLDGSIADPRYSLSYYAVVRLLQNVFEYFNILNNLHESKTNPHMEPLKKHFPSSLFKEPQKKKVGSSTEETCKYPDHSEFKKTLLDTKHIVFFQFRQKRTKQNKTKKTPTN